MNKKINHNYKLEDSILYKDVNSHQIVKDSVQCQLHQSIIAIIKLCNKPSQKSVSHDNNHFFLSHGSAD